jgi:hypothetical protein
MSSKNETKKGTVLSFDCAIQKPLRHKNNFVILEGFLSELFERDIRIINVIESDDDRNIFNDRQPGINIIAKDSAGVSMFVEIQYRTEADILHGLFYGLNLKVRDYEKHGEPYGRLQKACSIAILSSDEFSGSDYIYHGKPRFAGLNTDDNISLTERQKMVLGNPFGNLFHEYYLFLPGKFHNIIKTALDEWVYYIKNSETKDSFTAKGMKELKEIKN